MRYEDTIEAKFFNSISRWAVQNDIDMEVVKLNLSGRRGWPDRMILFQGGNCLFIEFKRPGEKARPLQTYVHQRLHKMGFRVQVFDNTDEAIDYVKAEVRAATTANGSSK